MTKEEQFDAFWKAYPRRVGKGAARKAFDKAMKLASFEDIIGGLRGQLSYYATRDHQFIPHPSTWLGQERWGDDPQPVQQIPRRQGDMADFLASRKEYRDERTIDAEYARGGDRGAASGSLEGIAYTRSH